MNSPNIISRIQFLEHGKKYPDGSRGKGLVSTQSLVGYKRYTSREDSRESCIDFEVENTGYINYTSRESSRDSSVVKTYSNLGWLEDEETLNNFSNLMANSFNKDGNLAWITVASFKDYLSAEDYNLFNDDDYAAVMSSSISKFFKAVGFEEENMIWWLDYHSNEKHPHVHLTFLEKEQTRTRGKFTQDEVNKFKGYIWNEINRRRQLLRGVDPKTIFKAKDNLYQETRSLAIDKITNQSDQKLEQMIRNLYRKLPGENDKNNRLQYNSSHMKEYREDIDAIVKHIFNDIQVKSKYDEFVEQCKKLDNIKSAELHTKYDAIEKNEKLKIHSSIANHILKGKKNLDILIYEDIIKSDSHYQTLFNGDNSYKDLLEDLKTQDIDAYRKIKESVYRKNNKFTKTYSPVLKKNAISELDKAASTIRYEIEHALDDYFEAERGISL